MSMVLLTVTFLWLLLLWLVFAGSVQLWEIIIGAGAAALALHAHSIIRRTRFAPFAPRWREVAQAAKLPWEILSASGALLLIAFRLRRARVGMVAYPFAFGDDSPRAAAHRALALTYTNVSPNSVVVTLDPARNQMFVHRMST